MFSTGDRVSPMATDDNPSDPSDHESSQADDTEQESLEVSLGTKSQPLRASFEKQPKIGSQDMRQIPSVDSNSERTNNALVVNTNKNRREQQQQQNAMESGVAQIANIGSIISSTFGVFNERFARFDDLIERNSQRSDDLSAEMKSQKHKIGFLKNVVDDIQDQMKVIITTVKQLEITVASSIESSNLARSTNQAETDAYNAKEKEDMIARRLQVEQESDVLKLKRDEIIDRISDVEREMENFRNDRSSDEVLESSPRPESASLRRERDELLLTVSTLEKKISEHEALLNASSRATIVKLDIAAVAEDKIIGIQHLQIKLAKADYDEEPEESEVVSSTWEPTPEDTDIKADMTAKLLAVESPRNDTVSAAVMQEITDQLNQLKEESAADKVISADAIEELNQRIIELEETASISNSNYLSQIRDINERIQDLQEGAHAALASSMAIKRLQLAMNDVIAEVDELRYKESSFSGDDTAALTGQQSNGNILHSQDHMNTASHLLENEILSVKTKLLNLRDDLDNGLDTYADAHAADPEGSEAFESPFIAKVAEFADRLDNVILSFHSKETPELTLLALFHPLDALTIELEALFELDQQSVASMGITFDDVTAEGSSRNVRETMRYVWEASLPLLDHRVNKITMRRRLTALEGIIGSKADISGIASLEAELRRLITSKADQKELLSIASKKVSLGELQRLKDQLMKQIVSIRGFEYNQSGSQSQMIQSPRANTGGLTSEEGVEMNNELKQLGRRFDILHSFHEDLAAQCISYVPREEVEQALRALLGEMKIMKGNSISPDLLGESLKTKASAAEVQKLVAALTGALGDITGRNDVAAAVYARCLICDKPVKSLVLAPLTSNKGPRAFSPDRGSTNQLTGGFYDKSSDMIRGGYLDRPSTMGSIGGPGLGPGASIGSASMGFAAWGSSKTLPQPHYLPLSSSFTPVAGYNNGSLGNHGNLRTSSAPDNNSFSAGNTPNVSYKGRTTADVVITHSSIDLPPLQIQFPQNPTKNKNTAIVYKQPGVGRMRVQAAAGGGTGPSYSLDSR